MENFGQFFELDITKSNSFYLVPDMNFTVLATSVYESDFVLIVEQPARGNITMTLEADQFAFETVPVLSTTAGRIDVLKFRYNNDLRRCILIEFIKNLTLN